MARKKLKKLKGFLERFGTYHVITDPVTGKQLSTKCTDPEAAKMWLANRQRLAQQPATAATVGEYCDKLMALKKAGGASLDTLKFYNGKLKPILEFFGREAMLATICAKYFDDYVLHRSESGVEGYTITRELRTFLQALGIAKRAKVFAVDLTELMPVGLATTAKVRDRALSENEVPALISAMPTDKWAAYCCLGVSLAVRKGEALRVRPEDVEIKMVQVHTESGHWVEEKRYYVWVRGTKTEGSNRVVPVLSIFTALFESALPYLPIGEVSSPARTFAAACKKAKIERCCFKDLRRTHATIIGGKGVSHESIAKILGHATIAMSQRVYNQAKSEQLLPVVETQLARAQATSMEGLVPRDESSVPGRRGNRGQGGTGGAEGGPEPSGEAPAVSVSSSDVASCSDGFGTEDPTFFRRCDFAIENRGAPQWIRTTDLWLRRPRHPQVNLAAAAKSVPTGSLKIPQDNASSRNLPDVFPTLCPGRATVSDLQIGPGNSQFLGSGPLSNAKCRTRRIVPLLDANRVAIDWVTVTDAEVEADLRPRPYEPPSSPSRPMTYGRIRRAAESFADRFGGA